ncbi:MAG: lipid-A-disaccharide synthase [Pseudomonadota bacterium]
MANRAGPEIYIIAGEPSGDRLGGALMESLAESREPAFAGVGGQSMTRAGLTPLFDMAELTVMGLSEVLPKLPNLIRRIRQTADDVIAHRPDVLITIDSPDFSLRVAARARRALPDLKIVHYVAPSVWAWRPGRAAKMARHVNHVLALLPFEPPYMHAAGMTCDFVGHPVAARSRPPADAIAAFRADLKLAPQQKLLLVGPGSRRGEVSRLMPDFRMAVERIRRHLPDLAIICPVAETVRDDVEAAFKGVAGPLHLLDGAELGARKELAFAAADAALCASGTITLELAAMGTPMVAAYKTTWLTAQIVRRVIKINSANLINLISGDLIVPEHLQEYCTPEALEQSLLPLLTDPAAASHQTEGYDGVMRTLGRGGPPPEARAAHSVLAFLKGDARIPDAATAHAMLPGPAGRHQGRV